MIHQRRVESIAATLHRHTRSYSVSPRPRQKDGWNDKLRILFCGTDNFSDVSLKALYDESKRSDQITSIDVLTRPDKRRGRGLKNITPPLIKKTGIELNLPVHQIDAFREWTSPDINLIVAVSFGLLIPPRIINGSKYGGLNVHPSLLPDLRGAAPIQWTILLGRQETGVSMQTLHPTKFDQGVILDQTKPISVDSPATKSDLSARLAPLGAEMLVKAIRNRLYLPPHQPVTPLRQAVALAPKLKTEDRVMNFEKYGRHEFCQRWKALGPLHGFAEDQEGKKMRVKFGKISTAVGNSQIADDIRNFSSVRWTLRATMPIGIPYAFVQRNQDVMACPDWLLVNTKDGILYIGEITVEGKSPGPACQRAAQAKLFGEPQQLERVNEHDPGSTFYQFSKPLSIE